MLDTSAAAYIAAYRRQDHTTCAAIVRELRACGEIDWLGRQLDTRSADQKDVDEEAEACGVTATELLRGK